MDDWGSPDYYEDANDALYSHHDYRPPRSQSISNEYPYKPHHYGKQKHARGYFDDDAYWLSHK